MSEIDKSCIIEQIQNCVDAFDGFRDEQDFYLNSLNINYATENRNIVGVATEDELPDLDLVEIEDGTLIYYVEEYGVHVINNRGRWLGLDGRFLRRDFESNCLWSWGLGTSGRLGTGNTTAQCSPVQEFCSATDWSQVSAGACHSAAVKTDGTLWSWGAGTNGQLGTGNTTAQCSPVQEFCSATDWSSVSAGACHTAAVKTDGTLWSWGNNCQGQLGAGTLPTGNSLSRTNTSPVQEFCSATDWSQVSAGNLHSAAVKTDGTLWSWGAGTSGQLGTGIIGNQCSPVQEFCSATDWSQVSASTNHSAAIKTDGTLWSWGLGTSGQLGTGNTTSQCSPVQEFCSATDWSQVSAGYSHSVGLRLL